MGTLQIEFENIDTFEEKLKDEIFAFQLARSLAREPPTLPFTFLPPTLFTAQDIENFIMHMTWVNCPSEEVLSLQENSQHQCQFLLDFACETKGHDESLYLAIFTGISIPHHLSPLHSRVQETLGTMASTIVVQLYGELYALDPTMLGPVMRKLLYEEKSSILHLLVVSTTYYLRAFLLVPMSVITSTGSYP